MYDIAREQSPDEGVLREWLNRSLEAGYNAVGFYLEHRFAYKSAHWAEGAGALQPDVVRRLSKEFAPKGLRVIPFLNTLGHMEGFIRSRGGEWLEESGKSQFLGSQMCPSKPECVAFARKLVSDAMEAFDDEWVHLGGDETDQLGQCPICTERATKIGKAGIYGEYFGPLCEWVLSEGRRPCLWGDMLIHHPEAMKYLPKETVIFDWHYDKSPSESTQMFRANGFEVVCCPALHTFDSHWCHWNLSKQNIDDHIAASSDALGVCVTTWELTYLTNYDSVMPLIFSAGRRLNGEDWDSALLAEGGEEYAKATEILGNQIPALSSYLAPGKWRKLRNAILMKRDPFLLWKEWREDACGKIGDEILRLCDSINETAAKAYRLQISILLLKFAVHFVRNIEEMRTDYEQNIETDQSKFKSSISEFRKLTLCDKKTSSLEISRFIIFTSQIGAVMQTLEKVQKMYGNGPNRPAWETLIRPGYIPGDQAAWFTE